MKFSGLLRLASSLAKRELDCFASQSDRQAIDAFIDLHLPQEAVSDRKQAEPAPAESVTSHQSGLSVFSDNAPVSSPVPELKADEPSAPAVADSSPVPSGLFSGGNAQPAPVVVPIAAANLSVTPTRSTRTEDDQSTESEQSSCSIM